MDRFSSDRPVRPTLHPSERQPLSSTADMDQSRETFKTGRSASKGRFLTKKRVVAAIIVVVIAAAGLFGWMWASRLMSGVPSYVDTSKYQAVFLVNGEFYFGKIQEVTNDSIKLTDVYYVQKAATTTATANTSDTNKLELIKLGKEVHGPEDMMAINRSQVLYVENLKTDGQVTKLILQDKGQK